MRLGTRELAAELAKRGYQISAAGISRAKKSGRADPDADGKYDPDEFVRAMALNTNAVKSKSARAQQGKRTESAEEPPAKKPTETLSEAQTRKEIALANLRELEEDEKRKSLLPAEDVRDAVNGMVMAVRTKLLVIGDELADKLAAISDPVTCRSLVDARIAQALSELSEYPADAA